MHLSSSQHEEIIMELFYSIFGIDIFGDGDPDIMDDAVILAALEEEEEEWSEEDDIISSGAND